MPVIFALFILFIVTFIASYFGSLTGGSGLLITPVLISFMNVPPAIALGSRRVSSLIGGIPGFIQFHKCKKIDYRIGFTLVTFSVIGAVLGFFIVDNLNKFLLKKIIGISIILILFVLLFENNKRFMKLRGHLSGYRNLIGPILAIVSAVVAVTVGGGSAIILSYTLIIVYGQTILQSSGTRKIMTKSTDLISSILFVINGYVNYTLTIIMIIASALGSWTGSKYYLKKGEENVKIFFYVIILILAVKIIFF